MIGNHAKDQLEKRVDALEQKSAGDIPQFIVYPSDPRSNGGFTVNIGDYWAKIDGNTNKYLQTLSQLVSVTDNQGNVTGTAWQELYNIATGGGGGSNLIVNIDYAIMVSLV